MYGLRLINNNYVANGTGKAGQLVMLGIVGRALQGRDHHLRPQLPWWQVGFKVELSVLCRLGSVNQLQHFPNPKASHAVKG